MTNPIEFGKYLRQIRRESGLTLRGLENLSGVTNAYLSQIENGKRGIPSPDILKKIHEPLDIDYYELMQKAGYIANDEKWSKLKDILTEEIVKAVDDREVKIERGLTWILQEMERLEEQNSIKKEEKVVEEMSISSKEYNDRLAKKIFDFCKDKSIPRMIEEHRKNKSK
ncbi:helix-turn-helix domain-containing protein [Metabacillus sp. Hm71]|uniref:helix-turn-helix domain-containing protein n=1 Tax=Metabacillus sp. Hm71 TaxID=3450743 RepID=UPI003F42B262